MSDHMGKVIILLFFAVIIILTGLCIINLNSRVVEIERKLSSDMMMGKKLRW